MGIFGDKEMSEKQRMESEYLSQQELQKQQIEAQQIQNAPFLKEKQEQMQAMVIQSINPREVIDELQRTLQGQDLDSEGNVIQIVQPIMNDLGVAKMITMARSIVNQNTVISSVSEEEVGRIMLPFSDDLTDDLTLNWRLYDIKQKTDLDLVSYVVLLPCKMALQRACMGGERKFLANTISESMSPKPTGLPFKKEGFFSKFKLGD